jgi:hypothetical protein
MARRVWVVPPTWHDEVPAPSAGGSDGKEETDKGGGARRRFSIRRTRPSDEPAEIPDHGADSANPNA